jgi:hypothetical protein
MQSILDENEFERFSGITIGKVYKISSAGNMIDVMLMDGTILKNVQVTVSFTSSRSGSAGLPISIYEEDMMDRKSPLASAKISESDSWAVIAFLGGSMQRPICLGFIFPEENEMLCGTDQKGNEDGTQFLWKHESNVYLRVAKGDKRYNDDGGSDPITPDIEVSHPSGLYIKIGRNAGSGYPDYTNVLEPITNWDKDIRPFRKLNPKKTEDNEDKADPAPFVHLYHPSGTYLTIDTEGSVVAYIVKDVGITVEGNVTELIKGDVDRTVKGYVNETIEGTFDQTVKQKVTTTWEDDFSGTIKGDATEEIDGTLDKTVKENVTETLQADVSRTISGDVTQNISGTETDTVTGAWQRNSSASIKDSAPRIDHD